MLSYTYQAQHKKEEHMKSKELLHKIEDIAEDVGKKTRTLATHGKESLESAFRSGRKLVREKKSDIASAIAKGKKKTWH